MRFHFNANCMLSYHILFLERIFTDVSLIMYLNGKVSKGLNILTPVIAIRSRVFWLAGIVVHPLRDRPNLTP